ncbi:MAG TPA: aldo/keto reductase, partial [Alkalispirochaeta sp.]|nr:aldo/keto reductase [Alkalispirochaeta sp.]
NVTPTQLHEAQQAAAVDSVQFGYNVIWRAPEAQGLIALPHHRVSYSTLAQGLLARDFPYSPQWDETDHRPRTPLFSLPLWRSVHAYQQQFVEMCRRSGFSPAAVAVIWAAGRVDRTLVGMRSLSHLDDLVDGIENAHGRHTELQDLLEAVTSSSDQLQRDLPHLPNMFGYVPTPCRSC